MGTHPIFESDFDCLTEHSMNENVKRESVNVELIDDNQVSRMSLSDDNVDNENGDWSEDSANSSIFNTSPRAKRRKRRRRQLQAATDIEHNESKLTKNHKNHLVKSLVNFKNDRQFTDYKINVDGEPPIHVHKLIMAATSNFFQRVLASGMQEAITGEINMRGISYETAQILVNFSYAQPFEINSTNAQEVLEAADCYEFNLLKVRCEEFLLKNIDSQNCFDFLQLAELRRLFKLKEKTMQFALEQFAVVTDSEDFLRVPLPILTQFLCDDKINATREEQIFQVGLKWLNNGSSAAADDDEKEGEKKTKKKEERKEKAFDVLKCTRLALLAPRFLLDEVENNELFQSPKCVALINQAKKWLMLPFEERKQEACALAKARLHSPVQEILVVIGGICNNKKLKEVDFYHKNKGWQSLAEISTEHQNMHSYSVIAHDNDIYITGGHSSNQCTVDIVSVYQSRYQKWIRLKSMNQTRERHGSACVDGHIYVVGGLMAGKLKRKPCVLNDVERFNPMTQTWESVKNLPRRCYSPGVINYRNKLYVIGGVSMTDDTSQSQKVVSLLSTR